MLKLLSAALTLALLAGCATRAPLPPEPARPAGSPAPELPTQWPATDGPEARPPPDLHLVPDAEPRLEAIRRGGPNKPYEVLGQRYEPVTEDRPIVERGLASWYGRKFHGRPTSSGEVYNMYAMTAAHATMPIPSYARVRNPANGREVIVRINDRGPFHAGRIIDLSYTAALKLDILRGVTPVEVERITYEDIRTGAWTRGREAPTALAGAAQSTEPPPVYVASSASGAPELPGTASAARPDPAAILAGAPLPPVRPGLLPSAAAAPAPAATTATTATEVPQTTARIASGFWVQLGAFSRLDGAEALRSQLVAEAGWLAPLLTVVREQGVNRLQAGPYASRADASQLAERLRESLRMQPLVVQRR